MKKWTKELLEESGYEVENAQIESVRLTMADHGVLTSDLVLNGHGWGVCYGGYVLGKGHLGSKDFEGSDGSRTVTSADVRCKVCANSGTAEGALPAPATSAWEALVRLLGAGGISAEEKQALLAVLRLLAAGNDAAMTAYARLEALWSAP